MTGPAMKALVLALLLLTIGTDLVEAESLQAFTATPLKGSHPSFTIVSITTGGNLTRIVFDRLVDESLVVFNDLPNDRRTVTYRMQGKRLFIGEKLKKFLLIENRETGYGITIGPVDPRKQVYSDPRDLDLSGQ